MTRRLVILLLFSLFSVSLGGLWWYIDARIDSYFHYPDKPDVAQIINACIADPDANWQLPFCQRGTAAWGLYSNDCRAPHVRSLFFIEKNYACKWLDEHIDEVVDVNSGPLRDGDTQNPLHELVRRHAWCQEEPSPCTDDQTRDNPNWCLPEPEECTQAQLRSIDWLLEHGADINQFEFGKMTVLDYAVREENLLIVPDLLSRGASWNPTNTREILELLEGHKNEQSGTSE